MIGAAARTAFAGGYDIPDNGTEALGRGGAFVAKADDGTALYYNVAGLARQRGTRVTIDSNFLIHDMAFTRSGVYPGDPNNAMTPWAGTAYPTIHDANSIFTAPMLGISTNLFKRLGLGFGLYGPSSIGQHSYGLNGVSAVQIPSTVNSKVAADINSQSATVKLPNGTIAPAPSRYDVTSTNLLIIFPTFAAAYQLTDWLDIGAALQIVYSNFQLSNANFVPLGQNACVGSPDYPGCDAYGVVKTSGVTVTYLLSALLHPTDSIDLGITYRPQVDVNTSGTLHAVPPEAQPMMFPDATATFSTRLPQYVRFGGRYAFHYADGTERADVELDSTWENWGSCRLRQQSDGTTVCETSDYLHAENPNMFLWATQGATNVLNANVIHNYHDTWSVRLGGAYNFRVGDRSRVIARAGFYWDQSSTDPKDTRLDFDTLEKYGFTLGVGYKWRGLTVNAAYAYVYSPARTVTDSEVAALSAIDGSHYSKNEPMIFGGNGTYAPSLQIVSIGLTVNFNEFKRPVLFPH